jgi:D-sedoheptulose 7-phosphate isomerase
MNHSSAIRNLISQSIETKQKLLNDAALLKTIEEVTEACVKCFKEDGKILFCGNGGSAADAQHIAAEFTGRFYKDREPLYAEALHVNSSYMTAVANDYSYDKVYSRMVKAMGRKGDILFAISTSGNSGNIIEAANTAREQGMIVVGMTGSTGGKMKSLCHYLINIPSDTTPRIQESHILVGHIICELVEQRMFETGK